jgi:hypothetical protein
MPTPKPLTPEQAKRTLANRLGTRIAPRLRQFSTKFGIRSKRVFLTWSKYSGQERGEGNENIVARVELLPTPMVTDLTSIVLNPYSAGVLPVGSVRVDKIAVTYTMDQLMGKAVPGQHRGDKVHEPYDFCYEIVEDGRGDDPPMRQKFRLFGMPNRKEGDVCWVVLLERISEDFARDGRSNAGIDRDDR